MMFGWIPSRAKLWAILGALGAFALAWLRFDARRDARRDVMLSDTQDRLESVRRKKEIDQDVETQDDSALIDRLTRR